MTVAVVAFGGKRSILVSYGKDLGQQIWLEQSGQYKYHHLLFPSKICISLQVEVLASSFHIS